MKKLIILTTTFVIFLVFIVPFVAALLIKMIPANDQPGYFGTRGIYGEFTVSQEFTSTKNNLTAIGTSIGNPNLKNKTKIIFNLFDSNNIPVRSVTLSGMNVGDGAFIKIAFDPIPDSKDKKYTFTLSSSEAGEEELINVLVSKEHTDFIGPAIYGEETLENGLPIVIYFKPTSHLQVARDIFTFWIGRIF